MEKQPINKQQTIRFFNKELVDKLNAEYEKSRFNSVNSFLNSCLEQSIKCGNLQKDISEILSIVKVLNEKTDNYQTKELHLLEQFVNKLITCEKILCRINHLLHGYVFDYELNEDDFENGHKDYIPTGLKGYVRLEQ